MIQRAQKLLRRLFIGSGVTGVYPTYAAARAAVPAPRRLLLIRPDGYIGHIAIHDMLNTTQTAAKAMMPAALETTN